MDINNFTNFYHISFMKQKKWETGVFSTNLEEI